MTVLTTRDFAERFIKAPCDDFAAAQGLDDEKRQALYEQCARMHGFRYADLLNTPPA